MYKSFEKTISKRLFKIQTLRANFSLYRWNFNTFEKNSCFKKGKEFKATMSDRVENFTHKSKIYKKLKFLKNSHKISTVIK